MHRTLSITAKQLLFSILFGAVSLAAAESVEIDELSQNELERELEAIDSSLGGLANYSFRGGIGSVGYRSSKYKQAHTSESIYINLESTELIDQIVLVPSIWRDTRNGLRSEGFPLAFQVVVGNGDSEKVIATQTVEDKLLPRIAPLVIDFETTEATWLRLDINQMSLDIGENNYSLQLSEVFIFSGDRNVALRKEVSVATKEAKHTRASYQKLTDGFTPYLMDAADGTHSLTHLLDVRDSSEKPPTITIDLGESYPIHQINLHSANVSLSIPMQHIDNYGVPRHLRVTGSNASDPISPTQLFEEQQKSLEDTGPIIMRPFQEISCRYIHIEILDYRALFADNNSAGSVGFTEIEVLSNGQNIATAPTTTIRSNINSDTTNLRRWIDGRNYYGTILPQREWMSQLALRHELEHIRPAVIEALNQSYEKQKTILAALAWAFVILLAGTLILILASKVQQQRAIFQTRQRIAADLHDELGANLHAIGLFSDLAQKEAGKVDDHSKWQKLSGYLDEVRQLAAQTASAARQTTNMLESEELYADLVDEMKHLSARLLTDIEHQATFENEERLRSLRPKHRIGLFLFYKESLTNIIRHSGATEVTTDLGATKGGILLTIEDNGQGMADTSSERIPASLKRRARLLKAKLSVETPPGGGTRIHLQLKH